jgi:hypothetical protein
MPDADGRLSDEEKDTIEEVIKERASLFNCSFCSSDAWEIAPQVVAPIKIDSAARLVLSGAVTPQIMLISPCGHTVYFNALKLGIRFDDAPLPEGDPQKS